MIAKKQKYKECFVFSFFLTTTIVLIKYVVLNHQMSSFDNLKCSFDTFYKYLTHKDGFDLPKPKLLISVTGGARNFTINEETKIAFKKALMKVASNANAWIITGGTDTGVMKLVGDAVREDLNGNNQNLIGIASWNRITYKEKNKVEKKKKP
jgi:hypothetical protein